MRAFLFWSAFSVYGQMTLSSGSQLVVNSGSTVVANDIVNSGGTIKNNGDISVQGDLTNNTSGLFDATSSGTVTFNGSSAQEITGDHDVAFYGTVDIDNANGVSITTTSTGTNQTINGTLNFTSGNLTLNGFNLTIGTTDPTGAGSSTGYIKTNSTGVVKRNVGSSNVTYPVGNASYNPVTLANAGTADYYGVRVVDNEPANGSTNHMVDKSWVITENVSGGSDLTVTPQWAASAELTNFDRTSCQVGLTTDNGANYTWGTVGAATGSDPYTRAGSGFSSIGTFAVGDYYYGGLTVDLKVFLAGAYNTTNHNMDNTLNTAGLVPTTDPYGMGTTASVPSGAVDWVKIIFRDGTTSTTLLDSVAKFVNQSGQIINADGSNMSVAGLEKGSYYISIHHRNHLPVMSASTVNLSAASPSFDYSSALAQAWADATVTSNDAMKEVETGVWGLWEGDATQDGTISYNGASNDRSSVLSAVGVSTPGNTVTSTYSVNDVNMDGSVIYNGAGNDRSTILNVVGVSTPGVVFSQHIPH